MVSLLSFFTSILALHNQAILYNVTMSVRASATTGTYSHVPIQAVEKRVRLLRLVRVAEERSGRRRTSYEPPAAAAATSFGYLVEVTRRSDVCRTRLRATCGRGGGIGVRSREGTTTARLGRGGCATTTAVRVAVNVGDFAGALCTKMSAAVVNLTEPKG